MPMDTFVVIYILSTVCCLSIVNATTLDFLTSLHEKHCRDVPLCNPDATTSPGNLITDLTTIFLTPNSTSLSPSSASTSPTLNEATLSDVEERNQCCFRCTCSKTCRHHGNCCIDQYEQGEGQETSSSRAHQRQNVYKDTRFTCITPQLASIPSNMSKATSYYMVSTCPSNTLGNRRIAKCKGIQLFGDFLNDVAPVYMKTKDVLYKNVHCLSCNAGNVNGATSLEPVLLCPNHYIPKIMEFESPTQIIDDLRRTQTPLCNVMFKFPRGIELSHDQYKSHVCIHSDVSVCNVTGQWINYDPVLSEACGKYNLPVKVTVPGNAVPTIFRNLACYACNYNTINTDLTCGAPLDKDEVELRLHVTPSISTYKSPISTDSDSGTNKKKGPCESGQFFDAHKEKCRQLECPLGQYRLDGLCVPIFKELTSLQYQLVVKTFIKQDALEIIVKDFGPNSGLYTDLLSNFHHNFTVLVQSVWIKANQQHHPMIVFNLTMTSYDTPLLYNTLLKTLNFLLPHDKNNMKKKQIFVFADHIHFDKGGTKAVDLIDNVEMYNLKYPTQHNKKNKPYSLEITEMRLCERVKLNMNEYDIHNAKLYLKHAKVSLYGREYFVNRKNQIFVCLHVYNYKQKHTTDVLSKPDDNIHKGQQDDDSERDVMRDFGFFIGCLALLMLFVAVALAKKNYLNKRLRQMAGASGNTSPVNDNSEITASDERPAEKTL